MKIRLNPFWIFIIALIFFLIFSQLLQDGIFTDGLLYAGVSHNLSQGIGSFWEPNYSKTVMQVFREQPPLYFGLMALFFKAFGSSMYVERFFCLVFLIVELFIIKGLWNTIADKAEMRKYAWLPVFFFIIVPVVFWSYANLVEETVMVVFASLAVLFVRRAIFQKELGRQIFWVALAAIAIVLSTLTKGLQGSFPLVALFIFGICERPLTLKRAFGLNVLLVSFFIAIYLLLFAINESSYINLKLYLENRLGKAFITGVHTTTNSHFYLLYRLFSELLPVILIVFVIVLFARKKADFLLVTTPYKSKIISFLLVGLSGALPLMLTREQRGFYLLTALPFFVIALAIVVFPLVSLKVSHWKEDIKSYQYWKIFSFILLIVSVVFTCFQVNKFKRDKELLHDLYAFLPFIEEGAVVGLSDDLVKSWSLQNYLVRYKYISADYINEKQHFIIVKKETAKNQIPDNYHLFNIQTEMLDLYIKN